MAAAPLHAAFEQNVSEMEKSKRISSLEHSITLNAPITPKLLKNDSF
jgi:hypothetical protein